MLKDRFFAGLFPQLGLVPANAEINSSECGFTMFRKSRVERGIYGHIRLTHTVLSVYIIFIFITVYTTDITILLCW